MKKIIPLFLSALVILGCIGFIYSRRTPKTVIDENDITQDDSYYNGGDHLGDSSGYLFSKDGEKVDFQPATFPLTTQLNSLRTELKYNDQPINLQFPIATGSAVVSNNELSNGEIYFDTRAMTSPNAEPDVIEDIKSSRLLDTANFQYIKFTSLGIQFSENSTQLTGNLSIRGNSLPIFIPLESTPNGYTGSFDIDLSLYGLSDEYIPGKVQVNFSVVTK